MEREKDRISLSVIKWIIYIQIPRFICDSPQNLFCELNNLYLANSERLHLIGVFTCAWTFILIPHRLCGQFARHSPCSL